MLAHGIEVWVKFGVVKKILLNKIDHIIAVSKFTKDKLINLNGIEEYKISINKNCIDPFIEKKINFNKPSYLLSKYNLTCNEKIILSISRISFEDRYKGYDKVISSLYEVKKEFPNIIYLICGKATDDEKIFLQNLINSLNLDNNVIFTGFINEDELVDHYLLADIFVLPSKYEGFGIVFIEAAAFGLPVIAGNEDASIEALLNGEIGTLVNPDDINAIGNEIKIALHSKINQVVLQNKVWENYNFKDYKKNIIENLNI